MENIALAAIPANTQKTRRLAIPTASKRPNPTEVNIVDLEFATLIIENPTEYHLYVVEYDQGGTIGKGERVVAMIAPRSVRTLFASNIRYRAFFSQLPVWPAAQKALNVETQGLVTGPDNTNAFISIVPSLMPIFQSPTPDGRYTLIQPALATPFTVFFGLYIRNRLYPSTAQVLTTNPPNLATGTAISSGLRPFPPLKKAILAINSQSGTTTMTAINIGGVYLLNTDQQMVTGGSQDLEPNSPYNGSALSNSAVSGSAGALSYPIAAASALTLPQFVDLSRVPFDYLSVNITAGAAASVNLLFSCEFDTAFWSYE